MCQLNASNAFLKIISQWLFFSFSFYVSICNRRRSPFYRNPLFFTVFQILLLVYELTTVFTSVDFNGWRLYTVSILLNKLSTFLSLTSMEQTKRRFILFSESGRGGERGARDLGEKISAKFSFFFEKEKLFEFVNEIQINFRKFWNYFWGK